MQVISEISSPPSNHTLPTEAEQGGKGSFFQPQPFPRLVEKQLGQWLLLLFWELPRSSC